MTTYVPTLHAVPGDAERLPLDHSSVIEEMTAMSMDWDLLTDWIAGSGWSSFHGNDVKAMQADYGSDEQILAIGDMYAELVAAYEADNDNWIKARRRVIEQSQADADELRAEAA